MTYPAESVQIGYQNHVEDVRSFLDSRHADHYTVFNLSQRNYRGAKFSNRVSALWPPGATDGATDGATMGRWRRSKEGEENWGADADVDKASDSRW